MTRKDVSFFLWILAGVAGAILMFMGFMSTMGAAI